jgi:hypothetical protein
MTDQTAETSRPPRLELSAAQVAGGALAAITSAVAGSTLGVNGTLAGAAVGSVVATVGGELYTHSLRRTEERVRTVVARPSRTAEATAVLPRAETAAEMPQHEEPAVLAQMSVQAGHGGNSGPPLRRLAMLGGAAAGVFALSLGALSVGEVIAGRPVADVVTGDQGSGTTISRTLGSGPATPVDEPVPTESNQPPESDPRQKTPDTAPTLESSPSSTTGSGRNSTPSPPSSGTPAPRSTASPQPAPSGSP